MISTQPLATTIRSRSRSPGEKRICPALICSRRPAASIIAICASVRRGKVTSLSPATGGRAGAAPVGSVSLIEAATLEARLALSQGLPSRRRPVHIRTDRRGLVRAVSRGAHDAGESLVAITGAGSAAGGDHHALATAEKQWSAGDGPALPLFVHLSSL